VPDLPANLPKQIDVKLVIDSSEVIWEPPAV
jgi:hypothetical protein